MSALTLQYKQYSNTGSPVLVLHGLFGSQSNWGWQCKQLAQSFSVYGVDLRNHGDSPHADALDYPVMATDVLKLLDALALPSCSIVGHSMGGKVAMQLALTKPERIDKLVVVDIAPVDYASTADGHLKVIAGMRSLDVANLTTRAEAEQQLGTVIDDEATRKFVLTNLLRDSAGGFKWRLNLDAIESNYDRLRAKPLASKSFDKPTLFIKGALSNYIKAEHEAEIMELFPDAAVKVIMGAGHWVHAEKPQALFKIVNDFLTD